MSTTPESQEEKLSVFQLMLLVLSLLLLLTLVIDTTTQVPAEISKILQGLDFVACGLFFLDFWIRFFRAESKLKFLKWGWIDLAASIPNVDFLRIGRLVRVLRIIRLLRGVRAGQKMVSLVLQNKPKSAFVSVILTTILLVTASSISILIVEVDPNSNIKTASDGLWFCIATITTVGFGDKYPVTQEGRIVAGFLMFAGIGLFGTLSGLLAQYFLGSREAEEKKTIHDLGLRIEELHKKLDTLPDSSAKKIDH